MITRDRRGLRTTRWLPALIALILAVPVWGSCIIPDYDIRIVERQANPGAVRIVERVHLPQEMLEHCATGDDDFCHQVAPTRQRSGLILAPSGPFCPCPEGQYDHRATAPFTIYAEDPDRTGDDAKDTLYGVLLLDPDPTTSDPRDYVAYEKYLRCGPGRRVAAQAREADPWTSTTTRDPIAHWAFRLDDGTGSGRIDLCNGTGSRRLEPGLHNLQFLVTDRPFFRPELQDANGEPLVDEDGDPVLGDSQCGVPDLASGATYATTYFAFECREHDPMDPDDPCDCRPEYS